MPFLAKDIQQDMQAFAERVMPRLRRKADHAHFAMVLDRMGELTVNAGVDEVKELSNVLDLAATSLPGDGRSWRLRCRIYLAHLGDHRAAVDLAREALTTAAALEPYPSEWVHVVPMITAALGWLSLAASDPAFPYLGDEARVLRRGTAAQLVARYGKLLTEVIEIQARTVAADDTQAASRKLLGATAGQASSAQIQEGYVEAASQPSAVVFNQVGNANTGEGKKVARELDEFAGKALPLVPVPDLTMARAALRAEFPYATDVTDHILADIVPRSYVRIRPTILVGSPGSGKSRFARRLLNVLKVPHDVVPCGGVSDGAFAGTPRRWTTGEPSLPVALITRYRIAGPGAVLDEIEKVGTSRHNGQAHDALLAFLEHETACRFHDPYVQAPCDVSHVTWVMTANSLDDLSAPLRDRCRVIRFPEPRCQHLPALSRYIITDIMAEHGLDQRWVVPLDEIEMEAIAGLWPGGSLRKLRRMIEVALSARRLQH
ncbi:AAA family ATPase [Microvirga arabica]|uniref:AAA family ATPase n=1 Tax=Microvirga arabica TaxID=1128671 RepID=UPI00193ADE4F|nr:AAA family ATPase [Microvirga arabica]MBM1170632.1 AAA family ATPase [Microvirga arabica]